MSTDLLFKQLEPPPGGAERFARRLDEMAAKRQRPGARALGLAATVAAVAVLTSVIWLRSGDKAPQVAVDASSPPVEVYGAPEFDRLLGRASPPAELTVIVNAQTAAVTELATANQKIRVYQID